jgi:hypothetical protein
MMDKLLNDWKEAELSLRTRMEWLSRARAYGLSTRAYCEEEVCRALHRVVSLRGQVERELEPLSEDEVEALVGWIESARAGGEIVNDMFFEDYLEVA